MKLRKAQIKDLLAVTFPDYKGRKFNADETTSVWIDTIGGGGSYDIAVIVKQDNNGKWLKVNSEPMKCGYVDIPNDCIVIVNSWFFGKNAGITFNYNPNSVFKRNLICEVV